MENLGSKYFEDEKNDDTVKDFKYWEALYETAMHRKYGMKQDDPWNTIQESLFQAIKSIALEKHLKYRDVLIKNYMNIMNFWMKDLEGNWDENLSVYFTKKEKEFHEYFDKKKR